MARRSLHLLLAALVLASLAAAQQCSVLVHWQDPLRFYSPDGASTGRLILADNSFALTTNQAGCSLLTTGSLVEQALAFNATVEACILASGPAVCASSCEPVGTVLYGVASFDANTDCLSGNFTLDDKFWFWTASAQTLRVGAALLLLPLLILLW